jgi:hypothetical protein
MLRSARLAATSAMTARFCDVTLSKGRGRKRQRSFALVASPIDIDQCPTKKSGLSSLPISPNAWASDPKEAILEAWHRRAKPLRTDPLLLALESRIPAVQGMAEYSSRFCVDADASGDVGDHD